jgi:hypothetical protein
VEEKDAHLEPQEEDTEAHVQHGMNPFEPEEAVNAGREDEGDDVEGHMNYGVNQGVNQAADAVQVGREDDEDDVEGHVNHA